MVFFRSDNDCQIKTAVLLFFFKNLSFKRKLEAQQPLHS